MLFSCTYTSCRWAKTKSHSAYPSSSEPMSPTNGRHFQLSTFRVTGHMVDSVEIKRVRCRYLSIDVEAWMNDPMTWTSNLEPILLVTDSQSHLQQAVERASIELDDEQLEAAEKSSSRTKVKFGVHGMHGRLDHIHPIIADGKAKSWLTPTGKLFSLYNSIDSIVGYFGQNRSSTVITILKV